ncbi:MAG: hypothetical protein ACLGHJ_08415 [Gammaproteobacteria bacterium]
MFNPPGVVIRGQVTCLVAALWNYDDVWLCPLQRFDRVEVLASRALRERMRATVRQCDSATVRRMGHRYG